MMNTTSRLERYTPWVAGILIALPVLVARYPPMTDLPLHEALVGILRHFSDIEMFPPGLYTKNLGQPNQLFHMVAWGLSYLCETDTACKIVVAVTIAAVPICAARLADHVGASRLSALLVAPLALGWLFNWGLIANLIGLAIMLALLPTLDRLATTPSAKHVALAVAGAVLLYFGHYAMLSVYATAAVIFALAYPLSLRYTPLRLTPAAAFVALAAVQRFLLEPARSPALERLKTVWISTPQKVVQAGAMTFPVKDMLARWTFFALCASTIAALFWLRGRERASSPPAKTSAARVERTRLWIHQYRYEIFAVACFACYLAFPLTLNGSTLVYQRFYAPAFGVLVVVATPRNLHVTRARVVRWLLPALTMATLLVAWPTFADSDRQFRALDEILPHVAKGSALAMLDLTGDPSREFSLGASGGRVLATRGGRLHYDFTDTTIAPVIVPVQHRWSETLLRLSKSAWAFRPSHDFTRFRYALIRSTDMRVLMLAALAMEPEGRTVAAAGEFVLVESTLEVVPLMAPDAPLPTPRPSTLRKRAKETVERLLREDPGGEPLLPEGDAADPSSGLPDHL